MIKSESDWPLISLPVKFSGKNKTSLESRINAGRLVKVAETVGGGRVKGKLIFNFIKYFY